MNQKKGKTENPRKEVQSTNKKEIRLFVIVMVVFTIGMAILLFYEVSAWWIWYIYLIGWTLIEFKIARNISLKWWHWTLIIAVLLSTDWIVLEVVEYMKK